MSQGNTAQPLALLCTKWYIPPARSQLVPRPRLLALIDLGLTKKLTLLSAPAGSGKTTLLCAWHATATGSATPLAWLSLDSNDNEPLQFWSYVVAALETIVPAIAATVVPLLRSTQPPPLELIVTTLINTITPLTSDSVLVLDDYHLITTPAIHTSLAWLLDHLPPHLHLVIVTRADPALPLTRLRARDELIEVRAVDLRFTQPETESFLTTMLDQPLSDDQIQALERRTEGWIAGLQLAALAMRDHIDRTRFIEVFTGSHRFVVDYLAEEVLNCLPRHLQTFLLHTCMLDRLCGSLCDALVIDDNTELIQHGQAYSQIVLEELERSNLFLVPLDDERQWYRYHHLFADVLQQRLMSGISAAAVATLHQRASRWYETQHLIPEAIHHALAASAYDDAARLIGQVQWAMFGHSGQGGTIAAWLAALPQTVVQAHPRLCLAEALLAKQSTSAALVHWVRQAEIALSHSAPRADEQEIRGELAAFQATLAMYTGDPEEAIDLAHQSLNVLPAENTLLRGTAMMIEAQALLWQGELARAEQAFGRIADGASAITLSGAIVAASSQAYVQRAQGRLRAARATCQQIIDRATRLGASKLPDLSIIYTILADLAREANDLRTADQSMSEARAFTSSWPDPMLRQIMVLVDARMKHAQGNLIAALALVEEGKQIDHPASSLFAGILEAFAVQLSLTRGDVLPIDLLDTDTIDQASAAARVSSLFMVYVAEHIRIAPIQLLIAAGRARQDRSLLQRALERITTNREAAGFAEMNWLRTKLFILEALAADALGDTTQAATSIKQALAAPQGMVRIFVDEGAPLVALLAHVANSSGPLAEYASQLLDAFQLQNSETEKQADNAIASPPKRPASLSPHLHPSSLLIEPLSAREIEILRLIAEGHSNQSIADTLVIALSTVKRHINNIYGKLDVQSRTQALVRAHELNLL